MPGPKLQERNRQIRERMLDVAEVRFEALPPDSPWLRPVRMKFLQDGKLKNWDLSRSHESVAIVVFNISRKRLIFVQQFRPASYYFSLPERPENVDLTKYPPHLGITLELCAGIVDKNKPLVEIAQDEVREECGYEAPISAFQKVITYRSIGSTSSRQTLFYVEVTDEMSIHPGGGNEEEGELIEIIEMSIDEVKQYISSEEVQSPPSFLNGISWFLTNKVDRYT